VGIEDGKFASRSVDFRAARRQIEALVDEPVSTRQRALAAYVALFDYVDADGVTTTSGEVIAAELEISKVSWLRYRDVLVRAGLLLVGQSRAGVATSMQVCSPAE
jgi:hypothetical protein